MEDLWHHSDTAPVLALQDGDTEQSFTQGLLYPMSIVYPHYLHLLAF